MPRQIQGSQKDFSAGEIDLSLKRSDDNPVRKAGCRQLSNFRIQSAGSVTNRPGRSLLFIQGGRTEEVLVAPGAIYRLCFGGDGSLAIRDKTGAIVASQPAATYAWRSATIQQIVWDKVKVGATQIDVIICFPGQVMQVASFSGTAWTFPAFSFQLDGIGVPLFPYFRIAGPGITMNVSALVGSGVTVTFSAPVLVPAHVGAIFRFVTRRLQITSVTDSEHGIATWIEGGYQTQIVNFPAGVPLSFSVGDVAEGQTSGIQALVVTVISPEQITVQYLNNGGNGFTIGETVDGPSWFGVVQAVTSTPTQPVDVWDEQMCSNARGWPQAVFADQDRLGFCNFPGVPTAIAWSVEGLPYDFNVGPNPTDAMVEIAPFNSQVLFVIPGPESSEFVFCDRAIFYIPISATNPLKPGSVSFQIVSNDGTAAFVQPRAVQEVIIYVDSALVSVQSIVATGAYNRPYETRNISDLHSHLIKSPICIAVPSASSGFPERYGFLLNSDGTVSVFTYKQNAGQLQGQIGWTPWSGAGTVQWIGALGADVLFSSTYGGIAVVETMDPTQYLDSAFPVNNPPVALAAPGGKGPLWFSPNSFVTLMDQVTRMMGTYQIDGNGFIIPQFNGGENLAIASLVAGQPWTGIIEPFADDAQSGQDMHQRMLPRRISNFSAYVRNSTGFSFAKLFSAKQTPTSPALGTIMNIKRFPAWNVGDNPTLPPPMRETVEEWRPSGYSYDPRVAVIKDTPGPLEIDEIGMEITI